MTKWVALTARKLKPGSFDDWRQAWESGDAPRASPRTSAGNVNDPDEILAFGFIERVCRGDAGAEAGGG